jgi:hypothetical protein
VTWRRRGDLSLSELRAANRALARAHAGRMLPYPIVAVPPSKRKRTPTGAMWICIAADCGVIWSSRSAAELHALEAHPAGARVDWSILDPPPRG